MSRRRRTGEGKHPIRCVEPDTPFACDGLPLCAVRSLQEHRAVVLGCVRCFPEGGNAPVVDVPKRVRMMLVGQAPGITEITTRMPFTGPAGRRLGVWLDRAGVSREEIYFSALARCFPGKAKGGGDRPPSRAMISNCRPHLARELEILRPKVVIPVGGLAIKELLSIPRLDMAVGETFRRDGVVYVPLPHPSGASTWLNLPENRERLARSLAALGELAAAVRRRPEVEVERGEA